MLAAPGGPDGDADGLSNDEEALVGTSPGSPDSDGDGLLDGDEFATRGTDPLRTDTAERCDEQRCHENCRTSCYSSLPLGGLHRRYWTLAFATIRSRSAILD